ncbi:MAG: hypothetical protein DIU72_004375, partial [Pseudomonadota bacterium]
MVRRNGRTLSLLAALVLALAGGVLGVGCGDDEDTPNGGTGGTGGVGGTGGTGGTGGVRLCGGEYCAVGEECKVYGIEEVCECDPNNDQCEEGYYCNDGNRRCTPVPLPPRELFTCAEYAAGTKDEATGLECVPFNDGTQFWLRPCSTYADCKAVGTFCARDLGPNYLPYCFPMPCGENDNLEGVPPNGKEFERCDPYYHMANGDPEFWGTCIPDGQAFTSNRGNGPGNATCQAHGTSRTTCRPRPQTPGDADRCDLGWECIEWFWAGLWVDCSEDQPCQNPALQCVGGRCVEHACETDADCPSEAYCSSDKLCVPLGECRPICDAGTRTDKTEEFAVCEAGFECKVDDRVVSTPANAPFRLGYCVEGEGGTGGTGGAGGETGEAGAGGETGEGG